LHVKYSSSEMQLFCSSS